MRKYVWLLKRPWFADMINFKIGYNPEMCRWDKVISIIWYCHISSYGGYHNGERTIWENMGEKWSRKGCEFKQTFSLKPISNRFLQNQSSKSLQVEFYKICNQIDFMVYS